MKGNKLHKIAIQLKIGPVGYTGFLSESISLSGKVSLVSEILFSFAEHQ